MIERTTAFVRKNERHMGAAAIILGFIWDSLTLGRPDQLFENVILIVYLLVPAGGMLLLAIYERRGEPPPVFLLLIVQFAFGSLAAGLTVFYVKSGSLEANFLFFFLLLAFIVGNEFLRSYYAKMYFHVSAWYFLLFSYCALMVPVVIGQVGNWVFIASGLLSLLIVALFLRLLYSILRERLKESIERVVRTTIYAVAAIYVVFNALYFFHIIPPVPLAMKDIGIYHSVTKLRNGNYSVTYQEPRWHEFLRDTSERFSGSGPAYCMSSVFAPVRLTTGIYHHWERRNETTGEWETRGRVYFAIWGGRGEGYRGYSVKSDLEFGTWRCSVETRSGALIGRTTFDIVGGAATVRQKEI